MADQVYSNTAEGGTDGTAVTLANSGGASGTAAASLGGSTTQITFEADAAKGGSVGFRIALPDTTGRYLRFDDPSPSGRGGVGLWWYFPGGTLTASLSVFSVRTAADALLGSANVFSSDNKIYFYNRAGTREPTSASSAALTAGWYRTEQLETPGASTTTARVEQKTWNLAATLIQNYDSGTAYDAGTTDPPARYRIGGSSNTTGLSTFDFDNVRWGHKAAGDLGDVANVPPTATISAFQTIPATTAVAATVVGSDVDGTIATYAWAGVRYSATAAPATITFTSGAATDTAHWTTGATGTLDVVACTVTDNSGDSVVVSTEVRVLTTGDPLPLSGWASNSPAWTIIGGSASEGAALNDGSSTTRVESPDITSTPSVRLWRYQPMGQRTGLRTTWNNTVLTASGTFANKGRVYCGASTVITERATSTFKKTSDSTTADVTTSDQNLYFDLTPTEVAAITDWGDVRPAAVAGS